MCNKYAENITNAGLKLLKNSMDDYASEIWQKIGQDVIHDVMECAITAEDDGFTDADVALAIGRAIKNQLEIMTPNAYQTAAMRTSNFPNKEDMLKHAVFGLCSEAGEVSGIFQKEYQGHAVDREHLKKELGDCLWMIAEACAAVGLGLEEVMSANIDKLWVRYPDGFEPGRSLHRKAEDI